MKAAAALVVLAGCGVLLPAGGPPTQAPVLVSMEREECLGPCPHYRVTVYADGTVEYDGREFVRIFGRHVTSIGASGAELLRRELDEMHFTTLADGYASEWTDQPAVVIDHAGKRVDFDITAAHLPAGLVELPLQIDALAHLSRWVCGGDVDVPEATDGPHCP